MLSEWWKIEDVLDCEKALSFKDLLDVALRMLGRMSLEGKEIVMVGGPMTTGGYGLEKNMKVFSLAISRLSKAGISGGFIVFDQVPFQGAMIRILKDYRVDDVVRRTRQYPMAIIDDFYAHAISAGHIKRIYFLPYSEDSVGALRERELAIRSGVMAIDYPRDLYVAVIAELIS